MFKALIRTLAVAAALLPGLAAAQDFPANSVAGRLSVTGDTGAPYPIPFATLFAQNPLAQGQMLIGSVGNLASPVTPSGDCTISIGGVFICARTNGTLFGTMAAQNANLVAITGGAITGVAISGGTITGLPAPSASTDAATKGYVDTASQGLVILAPTTLATAAVLPNSPTYNNGTSGVGATLTAGSNSALTIDGIGNIPINTVVLINNQSSAFQNGIYIVTTAGSGSAAWVLTRVTYFNAPSNMVHGSYTFITGGITNANTSWVLAASTTTVGTTAVNFNLFSSAVAATGITYTPPGTGAVGTTVAAELQRMVWIKDYGAKCDNSTDDTTAIQNAWNAAASQNLDVWLGGVGPYCKFSSLTMPTPVGSSFTSGFGESRAAMLHGPGSSQVMLSSTVTGTTCAINISATYGTNSSLVGKMSGFGVVQSAVNQTGTGLCLSGITKLTLEDVLVNYFATGINANDVILLNLEKVWLAVNNIGISGQLVSNSQPNGWSIHDSHFSNNQLFTIRLAAPCLVNIKDNDFESNGTVGTSGITVFINGFCPTSGALGLNFRDNYLEGNQGAEIELNQAGASVASVHNITGNNIARTHTTYTAGVLLANSGSGQTNIVLGGNGMADVTGSPGTFGGWADTTSPGSLNYTFNCTQVNIVIPNSGIDQHCAGARIAGGTVTSDSNGQYVGLH